MMLKYLLHGRPSLDCSFRANTFRNQEPTRVFRIGEVDITNMINNAPIDLFWNAIVKATIPCFHVKHWNFSPFRSDRSKAGIRIAEYQKRIGFLLLKDCVESFNDSSNGYCGSASCCIEKMVWLANPKLLEEDFVEFEIVVLSGMDEYVVGLSVQFRDC